MTRHCSDACRSLTTTGAPGVRRVLWIALIINVLMFAIEIAGSLASGSVALLADAVDFAGDAANYALSLAVLAFAAEWQSRAALVKGWSMGAYGVFVLGKTAWNALAGTTPEPATMAAIGMLALLANTSVALMLFAFRTGSANMRAVWLCSRNDAIANVAILLAAAGVFGSGSRWPDLMVALMIAALALWASVSVVRQANRELVDTRKRPQEGRQRQS